MSMFKTLQNNPGTISLFKSSSASLNTPLLSLLQSSSIKTDISDSSATKQSLWSRLTKGSRNSESNTPNFEIEVVEPTQLPTFDQIKLIKSFTSDSDTSPNYPIFKAAFPHFYKKELNKLTIPVDEDEYNLLRESKIDNWFNPPLVVDWDKQKLANDIKSLRELLSEYHQ